MAATQSGTRVSLTPRAQQIAVEARALLEERGRDALSMRNIAARIGIRAASLYEHFADKRAVENAIIAAGLYEQGDFIAARLAEFPDDVPMRVVAEAYRDFALAHPALYSLTMSRGLDREAPDVAPAERYAAGFLRRAVGADRWELGLAFWAFAHGVIDLEMHDRLPPNRDPRDVWEEGLEALLTDLGAPSPQA
ncbi:MAG: TetR/AcrR family transcriptional regulator [Patulibacter minatonensis]